jgi:hypothetical protein
LLMIIIIKNVYLEKKILLYLNQQKFI